ncbi:MAG: hypothetical protein PWQ81_970, partial [Bacteroidota bacterium]|nr:hypothetical protein [Bacteroidota bacterium]
QLVKLMVANDMRFVRKLKLRSEVE